MRRFVEQRGDVAEIGDGEHGGEHLALLSVLRTLGREKAGSQEDAAGGRRRWESRLALLVTPLEVGVGATHFNLPPFLDQFSWSLIAMLYIALGSNVCSQVACGGRQSAAG